MKYFLIKINFFAINQLNIIKRLNVMSTRSEFSIDKTLISICEKEKINIKLLIKNTMQFFLLLNQSIADNTENLLNNIIEEYEYSTRIPLSLTYKKETLKIAPAQKELYQNISIENRKTILNQIISIAINNNNYINCFINEIKIRESRIINQYSLEFFLLNEYTQEENINELEIILKKLNRIMIKKAIVKSYYTNLIAEVFKAYKIDKNKLKYIDNYYVINFLFEEFGKIYFVLNIKYKMSLQDKDKYLRAFKSKYNDLLIKYNNDIDLFIKNELNFAKNMSKETEVKEFLQFISDITLYPLDLTIETKENYSELIDLMFQKILIINH
jgi:hypothetical protein